jgi:hypothetical protein
VRSRGGQSRVARPSVRTHFAREVASRQAFCQTRRCQVEREGPDLAEPLGEDGERAGRDVTTFGREDHALNRRTPGRVSRYGDVRGQED